MNIVTVVDSPCGAGKTSWAIQEMCSNPDKQFVFVTPFLDEIQRIKSACSGIHNFAEPQFRNGGRKLDDFNRLLANGNSIVTTHSTFANANDETLQLLQDGDFVLILDEVLDILVDFNRLNEGKRQVITQSDIDLLRNEGFISVDEFGRVHWINTASYPGSAYADVERLAKRGNLILLDDRLLVWEFPPEIFSMFSEVYVLTYLFEGSYLRPFFEYHDIPYKLSSVSKYDAGYRLTPYISDAPQRAEYKELIQVHALPGEYKNNQLSATGFNTFFRKEWDTDLSKRLKNDLYNFFQNIVHAPAHDILWTCPKDYRNRLKGKGYCEFSTVDSLPDGTVQNVKQQCFLPLNARASNRYQDRHCLAYVYNMNPNPSYSRFFSKRTDSNGIPITVNRDVFAVSCLIQWVWRSAIRKGESIALYLPAPRMRNLLQKWIDGQI